MVKPGKSCLRGRLSTLDLLVLSSLDQLIFMLKIHKFFVKQASLMRRSTVLSLPPQLAFPGQTEVALPAATIKKVLRTRLFILV